MTTTDIDLGDSIDSFSFPTAFRPTNVRNVRIRNHFDVTVRDGTRLYYKTEIVPSHSRS
jgi:hypothetical protein